MRNWVSLFGISICCLAVATMLCAEVEEEKELTEEQREIKALTEKTNKLAAENKLREEELKKELQALRAEKERLELQYALIQQRHTNEMAETTIEKTKLGIQNELFAEGQRNALAALSAEKQKLELETAIQEVRSKNQMAALQAENQKIELENTIAAGRLQKELAELKAENEKMALENNLGRQRLGKKELELAAEQNKIRMEEMRINIQTARLSFQQVQHQIELTKLNADLKLRSKKEEWKSETGKEPDYRKDPFLEGQLIISDRRIRLDGPIITGTGEYITKRIHYYNNKSTEQPIFLVIDRCPGGSIMEGYRIVKAMEASTAPVHVVVKSLASSMAAVITAMAPKSYAYQNAVILHHEPWTWTVGGTTQLQEQLALLKEWERRLLTPVAKKMGISLEEFRKRMYKKNSWGDWQEFGDEAKKLNWVDTIVAEIRETGYTKKPADEMPEPWWMIFGLEEKVDEQGKRYVKLPRLDPSDAYFIHNPDQYYR